MDKLPNVLGDAAPPPLAPLTHQIISPQNIAAEQRRAHAQTLSFKQRWKLRGALRGLDKQLQALVQRGITERYERWQALKSELADLHSQYTELKTRRVAEPENAELQQEYLDLCVRIAPVKRSYDALTRLVDPYQQMKAKRAQIARALEDHAVAKERQKAVLLMEKAMAKEAKIYERLIIEKWTRLGFCERYTVNGKDRINEVRFSSIHITLDAIYYKIDTAYQTAFKNWKTNLPAGVRITDQLLSTLTLQELSLTCQRQITATQSPDGAWIIVHRLDSVDGLMNYVSFDDVIERYPARISARMPICVGVGANREVQWINLSDFPHWLIGGFTNSGKSNMVNVGICTLISKQDPKDLRLILIDLKGGLEFSFYENIPHLHGNIIDSVGNVADTLEDLQGMMAERFKKFRSAKAKRLEDYQAARPNDAMPRILCVFDEVASILEHGEESRRIMAALRQLTAKGRAVGIHIWLCTQRPDVKVIEGAVKANLAVRLTGRLPSSADSVTILGNSMAKDLASIPGRMALQIGPDPTPVQTPHITEDNIREALRVAKDMAPPPALDVAPGSRVVHQEWTVERVIELSIKHLGGNISHIAVWNAADDLSKGAAMKLVEKIWAMDVIEYEGQKYRVKKGAGKVKIITPIEQPPPELTNYPIVQTSHVGELNGELTSE